MAAERPRLGAAVREGRPTTSPSCCIPTVGRNELRRSGDTSGRAYSTPGWTQTPWPTAGPSEQSAGVPRMSQSNLAGLAASVMTHEFTERHFRLGACPRAIATLPTTAPATTTRRRTSRRRSNDTQSVALLLLQARPAQPRLPGARRPGRRQRRHSGYSAAWPACRWWTTSRRAAAACCARADGTYHWTWYVPADIGHAARRRLRQRARVRQRHQARCRARRGVYRHDAGHGAVGHTRAGAGPSAPR